MGIDYFIVLFVIAFAIAWQLKNIKYDWRK